MPTPRERNMNRDRVARRQGEEKACRIAFLGIKVATVGWNVSQLQRGCD